MTILDAIQRHEAEFSRSSRCSDWYGPMEADESLNDSARAVIDAYGPGCYIGRLNRNAGVTRWDGSTVYNFGADFVLPPEAGLVRLRRLIEERETAPYEGTSVDAERISGIIDEVERQCGAMLHWS